MDDATLAGLAQLAAAATPGPWHVEGFNVWGSEIVLGVSFIRADDPAQWHADATFVAACREAVPALIRALRQQQEGDH